MVLYDQYDDLRLPLRPKSGWGGVADALSSFFLSRTSAVRLPAYHPLTRSQSPASRSPPRTRSWRGALWRNKSLLLLLKCLLAALVIVTLAALWTWELHVEFAAYRRSWVQQEIKTVAPLSGCFNPARLSPKYDVARARGPKHAEVQAGLPLRLGMDCYDFAGTLRAPTREPAAPRTIFHTYWRTDLAPFGERQEWLLKSFFATQDLAGARLILWSNGDLQSNGWIGSWLRKYPDAFEVRIVDVEELSKGTALQNSTVLHTQDSKAWTDGDLVRLLVIWAYGGVWVDMDSLLTRDLSPLLEHEFVTQWDCYDKIYQPFNGAVMHFLQHSPYLCEAFHIMATSAPPRAGSTDWGSLLYLKLWRRLIAAGMQPFKVLPFCFTDARSCRLDNRLPDPFAEDKATWGEGLGLQEGGPLDAVLGKVFSVHLHNQWQKPFPPHGWVERLLLRRYDRTLAANASDVGQSSWTE